MSGLRKYTPVQKPIAYRTRNWILTFDDYDSCPIFKRRIMNYMTLAIKKRGDGSRFLQGFIHFKNMTHAPRWLLHGKGKWTPLVGSRRLAISGIHDFAEDIQEFGDMPPPGYCPPFFKNKDDLQKHLKMYKKY